MKLHEFESHLLTLDALTIKSPDGEEIPAHFHITEVGRVDKHFIDCGGKERRSTVVSMQLWTATDFDHRLKADKLSGIIALSKSKLGLPDAEVEIEYQSNTIGRYGVEWKDGGFQLTSRHTDCLASESCGVDNLAAAPLVEEVAVENNACTPGGGCC